MGEKLKKRNGSLAFVTLLCLAIGLLMLFCNRHTALVADDYRYCFSFADDSRIERAADILPSMAAHRLSMNGRVIAHFLVQLFLLLPKTVFNLVNAAAFVCLLLLIYRIGLGGRGHNALLLLCIFGGLWCLQPAFGQVFLWLDGAINYLWCAVLALVWLLPFAAKFLRDRDPGRGEMMLFALLSFPVGAYSENSSVALICMGLLFLLLCRFWRGQRLGLWMPLYLALAFAGFLYMMLAPAESANKAAELKLGVLLYNFFEVGRLYLRFWPLLASFALLYALALRGGVDSPRRMLALVFLAGSLAGQFVLSFALYAAGRSTYIALVLLLCANALLFAPLFEGRTAALLSALGALCVALTLWRVGVGLSDIQRTDYLLRFNQELIEECAARGERDLQIPRPYARTDYSALEGLAYLNTEDPGDWPNVYMAKYYGVDSIIGY